MRKHKKKLIFILSLMTIIFISCSKQYSKDDFLQDDKELAVKLTNEAHSIIEETIAVEDTIERVRKYYQALNLLNKATDLDSNYLPAYTNKQRVYEDLKDYQSAFNITEEIKVIKGDYPELILAQGILLEKLGKSEEAKIIFENALTLFHKKIDSGTSSIFNDKINICYLILFLEGKDKALQELNNLKSAFPDKKGAIEHHKIIIENFDWDEYFHM